MEHGMRRSIETHQRVVLPQTEERIAALGRSLRCGRAAVEVRCFETRVFQRGNRTLDVYSTAAVPRGARASYWNDIYARQFAQVTFNPVDRESFEAELRVGAVGPIGIARVQSKPTDIERTRHHISRSEGRIFSFLLQARGTGVFSHYGHETQLEEGDFTLCDSSLPHRFNCSEGTELIMLRTPPEVLRS